MELSGENLMFGRFWWFNYQLKLSDKIFVGFLMIWNLFQMTWSMRGSNDEMGRRRNTEEKISKMTHFDILVITSVTDIIELKWFLKYCKYKENDYNFYEDIKISFRVFISKYPDHINTSLLLQSEAGFWLV